MASKRAHDAEIFVAAVIRVFPTIMIQQGTEVPMTLEDSSLILGTAPTQIATPEHYAEREKRFPKTATVKIVSLFKKDPAAAKATKDVSALPFELPFSIAGDIAEWPRLIGNTTLQAQFSEKFRQQYVLNGVKPTPQKGRKQPSTSRSTQTKQTCPPASPHRAA